MKKIDGTVVRETCFVALAALFFSSVMEIIFLIAGQWDYTVLLGNLLGGAVSVLNFFLMGITIQNSLEKEQKEAKDTIKLSKALRDIMLLLAAVLAVAVPCFNIVSGLVSLFFTRLAVAIRPFFKKF